MCVITFRDNVQIELFEDNTFEVLSMSENDVELNVAIILDNQVQVFNAINNRLGGVLTP